MNKKFKIYQVDAFAEEAFKGNPAAVCILEEDISDELMKSISKEMNLSETAFVKPLENEDSNYSYLNIGVFLASLELDFSAKSIVSIKVYKLR